MKREEMIPKNKTNLDKTKGQGTKLLIILFVVATVVYFGFAPLFDLVKGGTAGRIVGATFGSIFAILMTMFLLNKQTEIDQDSKKSERVFDEKVVLYKNILELAKHMLKDGQIDSEEIKSLPFTLIQMQMIGGDEAIRIYTQFFEKISEIYAADENDNVKIPESQSQVIFALLSRFSVQCRVDLGISDTPVDEKIFARAMSAVELSDDAVKGKKDTSTYFFNGQSLPKSRLVLAVIKDYVSKNPKTTFDDLKIAFPDKWQSKSSSGAVFVRLRDAEKLFEDKGYKRHFFKEGEIIQLSDEVVAVSNQWGIGNIDAFVTGSNQTHSSSITK